MPVVKLFSKNHRFAIRPKPNAAWFILMAFTNTIIDTKEATELLLPFDDELLTAHTVFTIAGKNAKGNIPEACEEYLYEELN